MSNFEPYEVSKAKWLVAEVMSDDSYRSLPSKSRPNWILDGEITLDTDGYVINYRDFI